MFLAFENFFRTWKADFFSYSDLFRWLWRAPTDELAGVNACAPDVWGRWANAHYPRGSEFRPPDGHGDCPFWVTYGQRQSAHLAIDTQPRRFLKYGLTSHVHNMTENSEGSLASKVVHKKKKKILLLCDGYLTLLTPWRTKKHGSQKRS